MKELETSLWNCFEVEEMKISIIVPVYNVQKYLPRCLDSILSQTFQDLEILLIDDGSTDQSGELCEDYAKKDNRIRVIHKLNGGLSDARNAGIDIANGEYIAFVDSDDWIDSDYCELLYDTAIKNKAMIAECSYRCVYKDKIAEETDNTGEVIIGDEIFALTGELEWRYFKPVAWNKLYHSSIFKDGKRYPVGKYHEDEFFTHQAFFSAKKLVYVDKSKYNYECGRSDSITGCVTEKVLDSCYAWRERVDFMIENNLPQELICKMQEAYVWLLGDRIGRCYDNGIVGKKTDELIRFIQKEIKTVLSWSICDYSKKQYLVLCESIWLYMECRNNDNMRNYVYETGRIKINE